MSQHSNCVFSYQGAVISEWSMVPVWLCHVLISPLPFHDISENKCVTSCTGHKQILVASGENFGVGKICFEAQLGGTLLATNFQNVGFWMWKAILKWMIFTEPAFPWRISQAMKACAVCSIYNSEGRSRTKVSLDTLFYCVCRAKLCSALEVQKKLWNLLPTPWISAAEGWKDALLVSANLG